MNAILRRFSWLPCILVALIFGGAAQAQNGVTILFPKNGDAVRGQIIVRFTGIPDGGYANIKLDDNFLTATSQNSFPLNTFPPTFPRDGTHKISITAINGGGKAVGTAEVSFEVANNRIDVSAGSTTLEHWVPGDRLDPNVQRYRVFAVSNASIEGGGTAGGGAGGGSAAGGEGGEEWIPAPLDWQVAALMRRQVRDVNLYISQDKDPKTNEGQRISTANIQTIVQYAMQRQRESEGGGAAGEGAAAAAEKKPRRRRKKPSAPTKAPWKKQWEQAPETGQYFVKMIEPSGLEINATRKAPTIALADLLPTFPATPVSPGSTWETKMTFLGELSAREPVNVSVPITLTTFENLQTPSGATHRAAKLESRFQMPEALAKKIAINLILQGGNRTGGTGGATGEGGAANMGATAGNTASSLAPEDLADYMDSITSIHCTVSRVLWFDIENHRVLRSEDTMRTSVEYEPLEGEGEGGGGDMGAGAPGGEAAEAEPSKISYNLSVTTWLDDKRPNATGTFTNETGKGTGAHARDNVEDPGLEKLDEPQRP
jgi:hypothetical protein